MAAYDIPSVAQMIAQGIKPGQGVPGIPMTGNPANAAVPGNTVKSPLFVPPAPGPMGGGAAQPHVAAAAGMNFGGGASRGADGSYKLPSGETLPSWASNTRTIGGQQVTVAGNYSGHGDALWTVNGVGENADGRLSRRLEELKAGGYDVNDPNVQYEAMSRVRDDAMVALQQKLGRQPTEQELIQATGFAHIGRFVRGQNGETGFQGANGVANAAQPNPVSGTPATANPAVPPAADPAHPPVPPAPTTPPATPTPPAAGAPVTPPAAGGGGDTAMLAEYYKANPSAAMYDAFKQRGIDLTKNGPLQSFIRSRYAPIVQAQTLVGNNDPNFMANLVARIQNSVGQFTGGAGGASDFYSTLQQQGQQGMQGMGAQLDALPNQDDAIKYMMNANVLGSAGYNPLTQQARQDTLNTAQDQYNYLYASDQARQGKDTDTFNTWFNQQSPYAKFFQP